MYMSTQRQKKTFFNLLMDKVAVGFDLLITEGQDKSGQIYFSEYLLRLPWFLA